MKAIGDLLRLRCTQPCAFGIGTRTVAANDLDAGVCGESIDQRLALSICQQIDDLMCFQVAENSSVCMALAFRPIIDPQYARRRWCFRGSMSN